MSLGNEVMQSVRQGRDVGLILRVGNRKISIRVQNGLWGRRIGVRTASHTQLNLAHLEYIELCKLRP